MNINTLPAVTAIRSRVRHRQAALSGARLPVVIEDYSLKSDPVTAGRRISHKSNGPSGRLIDDQTSFRLARYQGYLAQNPHLNHLPSQYFQAEAAYDAVQNSRSLSRLDILS